MTDLLDPVTVAKPGKLKYADKNHAYWIDGKRAKSVTTVAKVPEDGYRLELWGKRMTAIGLASNQALIESVAAHFDDSDKLNEIVEEAIVLAKSHHAATRGTAMHRITERADRGEDMMLTDLLADTVKAWRDAMDAHGYEVLPEYIERCVVYPEQRICGKFDRIVREKSSGELFILDLKSGERALNYPHSIAVQLGLYVNAPWMAGAWDGESGETTEFFPMPEDLNTDWGLIVHMPEPGKVTIAKVDIAAGWEIAHRAIFPILDWRARTDLVEITTTIGLDPDAEQADPFAGFENDKHHSGEPLRQMSPQVALQSNQETPHPPAGSDQQPAGAALPRVDWIVERIKALPPEGRALLNVQWPLTVDPPKLQREKGRDYDNLHIESIERALAPIEAEHQTQLSADPVAVERAEAERRIDVGDASTREGEGSGNRAATSGNAGSASPTQHDEGPQMTDEDVDAMLKAHNSLSDKVLSDGSSPHLQARAWLREMAAAGQPIALSKMRSRRRWLIARAVLLLAHYDDAVARACIGVVMGDELQPAFSTGAAFAALTIDEAERLADMVMALDADKLQVVPNDDGSVAIRAAA